MRVNNYNLKHFDSEKVTGMFEMPILDPINYTPKELLGFNYAMSSKLDDCGIHFFLDDYQFERVWNRLEFYTNILKRFDCVFTPDFSLYTDMPLPLMIYNVYRSRLIGQYMQKQGIKVIPTISWADRLSYQFCFDGLPKYSTVAVSTVGVIKDKNARRLWSEGFTEMLERVEPAEVLLYGGDPGYDFPEKLKIVRYPSNMRKRLSELDGERSGR